MTSQPLELEGTWEEIVTHAAELSGRRVRVTVLPDKPVSPDQPLPYRPASGRSLLEHAGTWKGDDFEECLRTVYDNRAPLES